MTMWSNASPLTEAIDSIARAVLAIVRTHPVRVLIDGRSAAGKTTFSNALARRLVAVGKEVVVAEFDEFHPNGYRSRGGSWSYTPERYLEDGFDFAAFQKMVMTPAASGGSRLVTLSLEDPSRQAVLPPDGILLVDGSFLAKPSLRASWDFVIWLDVSFETMVERAALRDVAWVHDELKVRHHYETFWQHVHALYEGLGPRDTADAIVDNEDPSRPRLRLRRPE
jgi:uridine kinase